MKLFSALILCLAFVSNLFSQNIYVCTSYTEKGEPISASPRITIYPQQLNNFYILCGNLKPFDRDETLFLFIDKIEKNSRTAFDSKVITAEKSETWIACSYSFNESGKYEIYLVNNNNKKLASTVITVWESTKSDFESAFAKSFYYADTQITFCKNVFLGKPVEPFTVRSISADGNSFCVFIEGNKPLNTKLLILQVWRRKSNPVEYSEYITTKKYLVTKDWKYTFFNFKLEKAGDYKFILFNENEILIKSAYITITE